MILDTPEFEPYIPIEDADAPEQQLEEDDDIQHEAFDKYISARICVKQGTLCLMVLSRDKSMMLMESLLDDPIPIQSWILLSMKWNLTVVRLKPILPT
jgi:hypothetical protein